MKGRIKLAKISIKYKEKSYKTNHAGRKVEFLTDVKTKAVEVLIVINEPKRIIIGKTKVIKKVCKEIGLDYDKIADPTINSVEILKDLGATNYDID